MINLCPCQLRHAQPTLLLVTPSVADLLEEDGLEQHVQAAGVARFERRGRRGRQEGILESIQVESFGVLGV